jgi:tRNA pseudouridine32 synthase/23S rRNA pseudouridine746 synthase
VLARTPLHAAELALRHPDGGELRVVSPVPPDLAAALALLRG